MTDIQYNTLPRSPVMSNYILSRLKVVKHINSISESSVADTFQTVLSVMILCKKNLHFSIKLYPLLFVMDYYQINNSSTFSSVQHSFPRTVAISSPVPKTYFPR